MNRFVTPATAQSMSDNCSSPHTAIVVPNMAAYATCVTSLGNPPTLVSLVATIVGLKVSFVKFALAMADSGYPESPMRAHI